MASAQVVETSVTNNSPSQDSNHPDDLFQSQYVTPGFKPFSYLRLLFHRDLFESHSFFYAISEGAEKESKDLTDSPGKQGKLPCC